MRVYQYGPDNVTNLPVTDGAIAVGTVVKRGPTGEDNASFLVPSLANTTASTDVVGILRQALASADDSTIGGTVFTTRPVQLVNSGRLILAEYSVASADLITCTQAVNSTTMTVTSLEDNIDGGAIYVAAGTGIGQTNYLVASASGACTLKAAFGTSLDTTSKFVKILPRFHQKAGLSADGTKLGSYDAVGVHEVSVIDTLIERNNRLEQFNPTKHAALTGMNSIRDFHLYAVIAFRNSVFYTID